MAPADHQYEEGAPVSQTARQALTAVACLLAIAGAGVLFVVRQPSGPAQPHPGGAPGSQQGPALAPYCGQQVGGETAGVKAVALLPVTTGCQDEVGFYLLDLAREHDQHVSVRVLDMKSAAAQVVMSQHGLRCACVIVNGKTRFDLGGETGKVLLEGPMDLEDVRDVLKAELAAAYGDGAPVPKPVPPTKLQPGHL